MTSFKPLYTAVLAFIILLLGFIAYSNSFQVPFVFDDNEFIVGDYAKRMTEIDIESISRAALESKPRHRLLPNLSLALNYYFGEFNTFGYHVVNLIIHLFIGIVLFFFIKQTLEIRPAECPDFKEASSGGTSNFYSEIPAFFATLLWVTHPVATQSVTYVYQRMTSIVALFFLLSLFFYIKGRLSMRARPKKSATAALYFIGAFAAGICAIVSKENAGTLPFFILMYEWFFFQDLKLFRSRRQLFWITGAVLVFVTIIVFYLGDNPLNRILASYRWRDFTLPQRVLTEFRVVVYYVSLFFWPSSSRLTLTHDYPLSFSPVDPLSTGFSIGAIVAVLAAGVYLIKKERFLAFCILWFLGNLVIESSVIGIEIIFEHRTYLPFMMVAPLVTVLIFRVFNPRLYRAGVNPFLYRAGVNPFLYREGVNPSPTSTGVPPNFCGEPPSPCETPPNPCRGGVYPRPQQSRDGVHTHPETTTSSSECRGGVYPRPTLTGANLNRLHPWYLFNKMAPCLLLCAMTALFSFWTFQRNLDWQNSLTFWHDSALKSPHYMRPHNELGTIMFHRGELKTAMRHFRTALACDPRPSLLNLNIGTIHRVNGNVDEAIREFQIALKNERIKSFAYLELGETMLYYLKDPEAAVDYLKKAADLMPGNFQMQYTLASALSKSDRLDDALIHYQSALAIDSNQSAPHNDIANVYARKGMPEKAIEHYRRALEIRPENQAARVNMERLEALFIPPAGSEHERIPVEKSLAFYRSARQNIQNGNQEAALADLQSAVSINPEFTKAWFLIGGIFAGQGNYIDSQAAFDHILSYDPGNALAAYNMACLYARQAKDDEAILWLEKALENGYDDKEQIKTDPDLATLRDTHFYRQLIANW